MKSKEYLYIGIIIFFMVLAIIQWSIPEMLPMSLYMNIAWLSLELTILEMFKATVNTYKQSIQRLLTFIRLEIDKCDWFIETFKNCVEMKKEYEEKIEFKKELSTQLEKYKKRNRVVFLDRMLNIVTLIQVILCFVQFALMIVKKIPNNMYSNRTLGVISLFSFAFLLVSIFLSHLSEDESKYLVERFRNYNDINDYYMKIIEKTRKQVNTDKDRQDN